MSTGKWDDFGPAGQRLPRAPHTKAFWACWISWAATPPDDRGFQLLVAVGGNRVREPGRSTVGAGRVRGTKRSSTAASSAAPSAQAETVFLVYQMGSYIDGMGPSWPMSL